MDKNLHDDARIVIYPTILYITDLDGISNVIDRLSEYTKGGENEEIN
jgi:hypothetical protein